MLLFNKSFLNMRSLRSMISLTLLPSLVLSKSFVDQSRIPMEPLTLVCDHCVACSDSPIDTISHIHRAKDCETACFEDTECRYASFSVESKKCFLYDHCSNNDDQNPVAGGTEGFTRMHKRDPGVLKSLVVSSGCSLDPGFAPMRRHYVSECNGVSVAAITTESQNDLFINGMETARAIDGPVTVPIELYHDTPSVITIESLQDLEEGVDELYTCKNHRDCHTLAEGGFSLDNRCAGGYCRVVAQKYTIALMDAGAGSGQHASVDPKDGSASRETVIIEPTDADDVIVVYSQALQSYAGPDQEAKIMSEAHNNKPLEMNCEHCNKICKVTGDVDSLDNAGGNLILDTYASSGGSIPGTNYESSYRIDCEHQCYMSQDCVAMNFNRETKRCQLLSKCDEMVSIQEAEGIEGKGPMTSANVTKEGRRMRMRMLAEPGLEAMEDKAHSMGKHVLKDAENSPMNEDDITKSTLPQTDTQIIKQDNAEETGTLNTTFMKMSVPSLFRRAPGEMSEWMVFKRPDAGLKKFHPTDSRLLEFGGTSYGTVDLVGQTGAQNCYMYPHAGSGASDKEIKYMKLLCTKNTAVVNLYVTGRGISTQNLVCGESKCAGGGCPLKLEQSGTDTPAVLYVNPMKNLDQLGTMRQTVEVQAELAVSDSQTFDCVSHSYDKSETYTLNVELEFAPHNNMARLLVDQFEDRNSPDQDSFSVGYAPHCRVPGIRGIFHDTSHGCTQIPATWDPKEHPYVRFLCPEGETTSLTVNPVVNDASAKLEINGRLRRDMAHVTATDRSHGASFQGGVDFYYPMKDISIDAYNKEGVKYYTLETFCEHDMSGYHVILQNGVNLAPKITGLNVTNGEGCVLSPPKYDPNVKEYTVDCPKEASVVSVTPFVNDPGMFVTVNGKEFLAGEPLPPAHLDHGESHVWEVKYKAPIDPYTRQPIQGWDTKAELDIKITAVRYSSFGLNTGNIHIISTLCSFIGLGLAVLSSANFVGVAKFLQFLGILVAVHGSPHAFGQFCESFSNINIDFSGFDNLIPALKEKLKKLIPFDVDKIKEMAARAAGLPMKALKLLKHHAAVMALSATGALDDEAADGKISESKAHLKEQAKKLAMLQKKYAKQFAAFKKKLKKMKESFAENKGLLMNMFLLPMFLSALGVFYIVRGALRVFLPQGCSGYDWDQSRLKQTKPNFIFLFICDLGLIGFVKAISDVWCNGIKIELFLPDDWTGTTWSYHSPNQEVLEFLALFLFFAYPVFFLYFTAKELARNQNNIQYNKPLQAYADVEGCQEIKASQSKPIPIPGVGTLLSKVNFSLSYDISAITPIVWAKNLKGEFIYDRLKKKHNCENIGITLEGRVKPGCLAPEQLKNAPAPSGTGGISQVNTKKAAGEFDDAPTEGLAIVGENQDGQDEVRRQFVWESIRVIRIEPGTITSFREGDELLEIGARGDYEFAADGKTPLRVGPGTGSMETGRKRLKMHSVLNCPLSELENELETRPMVKVKRTKKGGMIMDIEVPPPIYKTSGDILRAKCGAMCGTAVSQNAAAAQGGGEGGEKKGEPVFSKTSAAMFGFKHHHLEKNNRGVPVPTPCDVDRDYEVKVYVGKPLPDLSIPENERKGKQRGVWEWQTKTVQTAITPQTDLEKEVYYELIDPKNAQSASNLTKLQGRSLLKDDNPLNVAPQLICWEKARQIKNNIRVQAVDYPDHEEISNPFPRIGFTDTDINNVAKPIFYSVAINPGWKSLRCDVKMGYGVVVDNSKQADENSGPDFDNEGNTTRDTQQDEHGGNNDDWKEQLEAAESAKCCGGVTVLSEEEKASREAQKKKDKQLARVAAKNRLLNPPIKRCNFYQRIYFEPPKFQPPTFLNKIGVKKLAKHTLETIKESGRPVDQWDIGTGLDAESEDWKDSACPENPFFHDDKKCDFYSRRILSCEIPPNFQVEAADGSGKKEVHPFNHVSKMELRGAGQCSKGESAVWLVLRGPSQSLKMEFKIEGDGPTFTSLLQEFKSNSTPAQQGLERTVSSLVNETWEKYKKNGAILVTDATISVDTWKVNFAAGMGPVRRKAFLNLVIDVDLERDGFLEGDTKNGQQNYDKACNHLLTNIQKAFDGEGKDFIDHFLKEVDGLMDLPNPELAKNKDIPDLNAVASAASAVADAAGAGGSGAAAPAPPPERVSIYQQLKKLQSEDGVKIPEGGDKKSKKCKVYLTSVKVKEELGKLRAKLTQIKFEDDFDHQCLNQAVPRDTLEVWLSGPCKDGLQSSFKVANARIITEKDSAKGKEAYVQVKLDSDVFCSRDNLAVEANSDKLHTSLKFLTEKTKKNEALMKKTEKSRMLQMKRQVKGGYNAVEDEDGDGKADDPLVKSKQSLNLSKGRNGLMELVTLHKGVSPDGVPYRLSPVFSDYPDAVVGRKRFHISVLGDYKFELSGMVQNKHIPVLHWFCPDFELECKKDALSFPKRDYYSHYYSQMKENQRWSFLSSRLLVVISIFAVIYFGKASEAAHAALQSGADKLKHLSAHEKEKFMADAKKDLQIQSGYSQLIALFIGTLVTFLTFAYPEVSLAYAEKEEERLEELKDQNMSEPKGYLGIPRMYKKLGWYLGNNQHRYFAVDAIWDGASFMYAAETMLVLILILGHPAAPVVFLPQTLCAWLLIGVTFYTLMRLNMAFLVDQWAKLMKKLDDFEDRLVAEYEAQVKKAKEIYEQVRGYPGMLWGKVEEVIDEIKGYVGMAQKLKDQSEEMAKRLSEKLLDDDDDEEELDENGNPISEEEKLKRKKEKEREMEKLKGTPFSLLTKRQQDIVLEPESKEEDGVTGGKSGWFGWGTTLDDPETLKLKAEKERRKRSDEGVQLKEELCKKLYNSDYTSQNTDAEVFKYLEDTDKSGWEKYTKDYPAKANWLDGKLKQNDQFMLTKPCVIQGGKAHREIKAATGLSETDPIIRLNRMFARQFYKNVIALICAPCIWIMKRNVCSKIIKFGFTPVAAYYFIWCPFWWDNMGFWVKTIILAIGVNMTLSIYKWGVAYAKEPEDERQYRKEQEQLAILQATQGDKIMSVHQYSVLSDNIRSDREHVESALKATEGVDTSWARGESKFIRLPPVLVETLRKPVPDCNKGYFAVNVEKIGNLYGKVKYSLPPWIEMRKEKMADEAEPNPNALAIETDITAELEAVNMLKTDELFTVRDYVFDYSDLIIDTLGIRLRSEIKPVRHSKTLSKKLLEVNKAPTYSRELVKSFPIQVDLEWFYPAGEDVFSTDADPEDGGDEGSSPPVSPGAIDPKELEGLSPDEKKKKIEEKMNEKKEEVTEIAAGIEKQVACTIQVVNFVGKGAMDCPENDSYLTLTKDSTAAAGKAGIDLSRFQKGKTIVFGDLKVGDLWEIFPQANNPKEECFETPKLSDSLSEEAIMAIKGGEKEMKPNMISWMYFDKVGNPATKKNMGQREGSHQMIIDSALDSSSPGDSFGSNITKSSKSSSKSSSLTESSHSILDYYYDEEGNYHRDYNSPYYQDPEENIHGPIEQPLLIEGQHQIQAPEFGPIDPVAKEELRGKALTRINYEFRPADTYWSGKEGTIVEIYDKHPRNGELLKPKQIKFRVKIKDNQGISRDFAVAPVIAGSTELLCRLTTDETLEQSKARKVSEWFQEIESWLGELGASSNRRSNSHKLFDTLFWGKPQTSAITKNGGKPKVDEDYKKYLTLPKYDKCSDEVMEKNKSLYQRILDYKDKGIALGDNKDEKVSFNQTHYLDYLMYGNKHDSYWPGFIHWFRKIKKKSEQDKGDLNKNDIFHTKNCNQVPDPGLLVQTLTKPTLSPQVLHVVLTDSELRAPGDIVESWAPQRGEPHAAEYFNLSSRLDNTGLRTGAVVNGFCGLLKLFPSKIVFESPRGDAEFGDLTSMSDEVNIDFSDIYCMHAQIEDIFHPKDERKLLVNGKTLFIQRKSGSIVAFGMSEEKIRMWADLIEKYEMQSPYQTLFGYDGETSEHPLNPNFQMREGKQGYQKHYMVSKSLNKGQGAVPKAVYRGSWQENLYSGDGVYTKIQVSNEIGEKVKWNDVWNGEDGDHEHHFGARFEREVVIYDGSFHEGRRSGKGIGFFKMQSSSGSKTMETFRFNGLWFEDKPIVGELQRMSEKEPSGGSTVLQYYTGYLTSIPKPPGTTDMDNIKPTIKEVFYDISPWELYSGCALSLFSSDLTPAMVLHRLRSDFGGLMVDNKRPLRHILALKDEFNRKIADTAAAQTYFDEDLEDFDLFVLSRCLEGMTKLPNIKSMLDNSDMPRDKNGKVEFRDGTKAIHYQFKQNLTVKPFEVDPYIQKDVNNLYKNWFKYDCCDDSVTSGQGKGTYVAIDSSVKNDSQWVSFKESLQQMKDDWNNSMREIPYEEVASIIMQIGKKKPKNMSYYVAKEEVETILKGVLPITKDEAAPWYLQVTKNLYAEDHWESKEVFRSLARKLQALNPTRVEFKHQLKTKIPKESKNMVDRKKKIQDRKNKSRPFGVKTGLTIENGTDLALPTEFMDLCDRKQLQVFGVVDKKGGKIDFTEDMLPNFEYHDDDWTIGYAFEYLAQNNGQVLNGYLKLKGEDSKTKTPLSFASPVVDGGPHGDRAQVDTAVFSYVGGYRGGKFEGYGELEVKDKANAAKFSNMVKYKGEWKKGQKHGDAEFDVIIPKTGDTMSVKGQFDDNKLIKPKSIVVTASKPENKALEWSLDESKKLTYLFDGLLKVTIQLPQDLDLKTAKTIPLSGDVDFKETINGKEIAIKGKLKNGILEGAVKYSTSKDGSYDGPMSGGKRTGGIGTYIFGSIKTSKGKDAAENNIDWGGTKIECLFTDDKPMGPVKVTLVKDGKQDPSIKTCTVLPNPTEPSGLMIKKLPPPFCCCGDPGIPTNLLLEDFPKVFKSPTFEIDHFNSEVEMEQLEVDMPWPNGKLKF